MMVFAILAMTGGELGDPTLVPNPAPVVAEVAAVALDTSVVSLRIEGMTCGGCAVSARIVLERLEGVRKANVNYEQKIAVVTYDGSKTTPERMIAALREKLKYTATVVETKKP